jgi:histidinol-phosphate aminotransferase
MTPFPRRTYAPLEPYAPDRRPVALDLSDNTSRWGAHPAARAALKTLETEDLLRYPSVYADRLRAAVARRFHVPEESVSTGCGSDDLLDSAFRAVCEPGQGVRFMPPTFSMVEIFARMNGLEPMPLERGGPGGAGEPFGPLPDPQVFLEGRPGLLYLCRPNNPTGEVLPARWFDALVEAVEADGPVLLVDEAYADFMESGADGERGGTSLVRRAAESRRVVVLRTLSKAYGLAGLRVGIAVGAPEVVRELEKSRGPYKVSRPAEAAAVAALEDGSGWLDESTALVRRERARLADELAARGLPALPSGGNFLCIPLAPIEGKADGLTAALRERGVAVRPFPALPGLGDAIRVSIAPRSEMDTFLAALDGILT